MQKLQLRQFIAQKVTTKQFINKKIRLILIISLLLSERSDSNGRPLAPHASTLANCATPRK